MPRAFRSARGARTLFPCTCSAWRCASRRARGASGCRTSSFPRRSARVQCVHACCRERLLNVVGERHQRVTTNNTATSRVARFKQRVRVRLVEISGQPVASQPASSVWPARRVGCVRFHSVSPVRVLRSVLRGLAFASVLCT